MMDSWMDQIVDNFLNMAAKATPEQRAEILGRVTTALVPQSPLDPGASPDTLPINQVSHVTRQFGKVVEDPGQEHLHPHERKTTEDRFAMRTRKKTIGRSLGDPKAWE